MCSLTHKWVSSSFLDCYGLCGCSVQWVILGSFLCGHHPRIFPSLDHPKTPYPHLPFEQPRTCHFRKRATSVPAYYGWLCLQIWCQGKLTPHPPQPAPTWPCQPPPLIYIYIYIYICICHIHPQVYIYIYIYILCVYIYIYIYIYTQLFATSAN